MKPFPSRSPEIDGLKGLSILAISFSHYIGGFYNFTSSAIPNLFTATPLNIFYNGHSAIFMFNTIGAYLIASKIFASGNVKPVSLALKRYLRFVIVIFITTFFSYVLLESALIKNRDAVALSGGSMPFGETIAPIRPGIADVFYTSFVKTFFFGVNPYNMPLWFFKDFFLGSVCIFLFLFFFRKTKLRWLLYILLLYPSYLTYYSPFLFGLILSDIQCNYSRYFILFTPKPLLVYALIIGVILNSYPLFSPLTNQKNNIFGLMTFMPDQNHNATIYYTVGCIFILVAAMRLDSLKRILSAKIFCLPGRLSFSICAVHYVMAVSFSSIIFIELMKLFPQLTSFLITLIFSTICILFVSYLLFLFIETPSILLVNRIFCKISPLLPI